MGELTEKLFSFLLVLFLPLVLVAGGLIGLFAVGALFNALDNPQEVRARIEGAFRHPLKEGRMAGETHYYRPYWGGRG